MRINLIVPFEEKDIVKRRGALWDMDKKVWYVENHPRLDLFTQWISKNLLKPTESKPLQLPEFVVTQPRTPRFKKKKRI
jgi:hypothetical protein